MKRPEVIALGVGAAGFAAWAFGGDHSRRHALAYLIAYAFAVSIPLGALAWTMVCDACGATWLVPLRRGTESITAAFPALALLFLPILMNLHALYPWVQAPPDQANDAGVVAGWHAWLQPAGFALRAGLCFAVWIAIAEMQRRWSLCQELPGAPDLTHRRRALSAAALLPFAFTVTCAAFDWYMSLETSWRSTIYGLLHLSGMAAAGASVLIMYLHWARRAGRLPTAVGAEHTHALGNLLLTSVLLWAYLSVMQLLVVWMADLPDEAAWYVPRIAGTWGAIGIALILLHAIAPWMLLLFRRVKRATRSLACVAVLVLGAHWLDLYWQLAPAVTPDDARPVAADAFALVAVLGGALALALWRARGVAAFPLNDPDLAAGLTYRSHA